MKPVKKEDEKTKEGLIGRQRKKDKVKSMKDKKEVEETKEQVESAQLARIKVKIEDTVQDEFVMRPKTRSRVKHT